MQTKLFSVVLALATLTTASSAFAADGRHFWRRDNSYSAPVYKPEPRYQPTDYRPAPTYKPADDYRPVRKPKRDGYGY